MKIAGMTKAQVVAGLITEAERAGETDPSKTADSIMRFLDQAERREIASLGDPFVALTTLIQYADFTIGPDSPGHHPTMPSAVAAAKGAMTALYRGLRGMEFDPPKAGPVVSFAGVFDDEEKTRMGQIIAAALAYGNYFKNAVVQDGECWRMVEALRVQEGDSVEILCDNPDGLNAVVCSGDWTDFKEVRFEGVNTWAALEAAVAARINGTLPLPVVKADDTPDVYQVVNGLTEDYEKWIKKANWRTCMKLTREGVAGLDFIKRKDGIGAAVVVIDLLKAIDKAIASSGAETCAGLTPAGQAASRWLMVEGMEYRG